MNDPVPVYVVTSGCYSGYSISAVFDTLDAAREYVRSGGSDPDKDEDYGYRVETYYFNRATDERVPYYASVNLATGDVFIRRDSGKWYRGGMKAHDMKFGRERDGVPTHLMGVVLARDEEHARKIAGEQYAMWKARREGMA